MKENCLFCLVVVVTNIIQAVTGFAGTMLAMPVSILLIGMYPAKAVLNLVGLLTSLWIAVCYKADVLWTEVIKITLHMALGICIGLWIIDFFPVNWIMKGYGIVIIAIALKKMFMSKEKEMPEWMLPVVLVAAGIMHGLFISGGSVLVIYASSKFHEKRVFRATLSAVWVILNSALLVIHIYSGYFAVYGIEINLWAVLAAIIGLAVGNKIHGKIRQDYFFKITYVLLAISGILMLQ